MTLTFDHQNLISFNLSVSLVQTDRCLYRQAFTSKTYSTFTTLIKNNKCSSALRFITTVGSRTDNVYGRAADADWKSISIS